MLAALALAAIAGNCIADKPDSTATVAAIDGSRGLSEEWSQLSRRPIVSCDQCHKLDPLFSHPVGVTPSMDVPEQLPLDHGRVTCLTCHDVEMNHAKASGPMLREVSGVGSICQECHDSPGRDWRSAHGAGLEKAHLKPAGKSLADDIRESADGLDEESTTCVTCHDGTFGGDAGGHRNMSPVEERTQRSDHSVGVEYRSRRSFGDDIRLVEPMRLDKRVRLFGRTVGCGSCHSPYSNQSKLLVLSNQGSRLCLSCHIQ